MKRSTRPTLLLFAAALASLLLGACAASSDPCAPANITTEVAKVNSLMREFDDAAQLASQVKRDQLVDVIPSLQEIRRRAEDLDVPYCLATLKSLQVTHMNTVINTLLSFVGGAEPDLLVQGIALARMQHEDYNRELARLMGVTYEPPETSEPPGEPPETPEAASETPAAILVTNQGSGPVNIRTRPDMTSELLATLEPGQSLPALGQTEDGEWIQVAGPDGGTGWVAAVVVEVSGGANGLLPFVTPQP
jgi:outer membrane murein-binding lipoprotein Lpp